MSDNDEIFSTMSGLPRPNLHWYAKTAATDSLCQFMALYGKNLAAPQVAILRIFQKMVFKRHFIGKTT
nr:hypothetical protein [Amylibacter sp.]